MWWSDRRRLLAVLAAAPLAACGYTPALAPGRPAAGLYGRLRADDPADRRAQAFVARIEERLGRPQAPVWGLGYVIEAAPRGVGLTPAGATTRQQLHGAVTFTLRELASGAERLTGRVESFTAWSTTASAVATLAAEEAAEARLMRILADQVAARLMAWPGAAGP